MFLRTIQAFTVGLCLLGCEKPKNKQLTLAIRDREKEKGHRIESFEIKRHKEKSPQSHTFYYQAQVTDTVAQKAMTVSDSVWLYQRNDSTWTIVPR